MTIIVRHKIVCGAASMFYRRSTLSFQDERQIAAIFCGLAGPVTILPALVANRYRVDRHVLASAQPAAGSRSVTAHSSFE